MNQYLTDETVLSPSYPDFFNQLISIFVYIGIALVVVIRDRTSKTNWLKVF